MPTGTGTSILNHLQLGLPAHRRAIFTKQNCEETGPLAVLCGDVQRHQKGTIDTINLVRASVTIVYVTLSETRVLHHIGARLAPFLQLPAWPRYRLFHQYLTARDTGTNLPDKKDKQAA